MKWPNRLIRRETENVCSLPRDFSVLAFHPSLDLAALPAFGFCQTLPKNFSLFLKNIINILRGSVFLGGVAGRVAWNHPLYDRHFYVSLHFSGIFWPTSIICL